MLARRFLKVVSVVAFGWLISASAARSEDAVYQHGAVAADHALARDRKSVV